MASRVSSSARSTTAVSTANGTFTFPALNPGKYTETVALQGFKSAVLKDVEGTMVGFYSPNYIGALNVPGLHLHFISKDHKMGGHVLAFTAKSATAALHTQDRWLVEIPHTKEFQGADLNKDYSGILKAAMKKK